MTHLHCRAKIIATLGPASSSVATIGGLIAAGMNVARLNMSHGTRKSHAELIANIRRASAIAGREVAILMDLQGPKLRVGRLTAPLAPETGETWAIGPAAARDRLPAELAARFIPTTYEALADDCREGHRVLFADGLLAAKAVHREGNALVLRIIAGGTLESAKGINLPDSRVSAPSFTDRDRENLEFGLAHGIDIVALSFVRRAGDVERVRRVLEAAGESDDATPRTAPPVIAKIESREGIEHLAEIAAAADGIMVARGDLGVEIGNHLVPAVQKHIIHRCNLARLPVITATQMLESMIYGPTPTRAEASDVANAVWDGTDALMLSGETAAGKNPAAAVAMMAQIITEAEKTPKERPSLKELDLTRGDDAIMLAASLVAEKTGARRILAISESGNSCRRIAGHRPVVPVLGISRRLETVRRMCIYWGISPYLIDNIDEERATDIEAEIIARVKEPCDLETGDRVVITRGAGALFAAGSANSVTIRTVTDEHPAR
ncbi:MAG: pyruvate kinase [Deltaproteobacteria bacterium]|nr:pyruvate kinase [Candidatus Anaeroferrophillacea bacterium]